MQHSILLFVIQKMYPDTTHMFNDIMDGELPHIVYLVSLWLGHVYASTMNCYQTKCCGIPCVWKKVMTRSFTLNSILGVLMLVSWRRKFIMALKTILMMTKNMKAHDSPNAFANCRVFLHHLSNTTVPSFWERPLAPSIPITNINPILFPYMDHNHHQQPPKSIPDVGLLILILSLVTGITSDFPPLD